MTSKQIISALVDKFETIKAPLGVEANVYYATDTSGQPWTLEVDAEGCQLQGWRSAGGEEAEACDMEATNASELQKVQAWLKMAAACPR